MFFDDSELVQKKQKIQFERKKLVSLEYINRDIDWFTDGKLVAAKGDTLIYDVEVYANYFCVSFASVTSGKVVSFEMFEGVALDIPKLNWILNNFLLVGFNNKGYDNCILAFAIKGAPIDIFVKVTELIIKDRSRPSEILEQWGITQLNCNCIDLIEVAPLKASLKKYGARLHCKRLQDLPYEPLETLTREEMINVLLYNINDLDNTNILYQELLPQLTLRLELSNEYRQDLRSLSDAQIAEHVISAEVAKLNKKHPKRPTIPAGTSFKYQVPDYISYTTPVLQEMLATVRAADFVVTDKGKVAMPPEIAALRIRIGSGVYRMGIGGLHSSEECVSHKANDDVLLIDRDVASYYPMIILNQGLFPKHLGQAFLQVYRTIVNRRIAAKKAKNNVVADALKITINGSFGKLGSRFSKLFSPDLMIQVTITGQLSLLMFIEMLETRGFTVISANTDGIVIKCAKERYNELNQIVQLWEQLTNFETEETQYSAVYSRDVNNYIAVKLDGKTKNKGAFANHWDKLERNIFKLHKNPVSLICIQAVCEKLTKDTSIEQTINQCRDLTKFIVVRDVKGGAEKDGVLLGKVVRWYYSTDIKGNINYITNGNKVPTSDNARPCMDFPNEFPTDVDFERYINDAQNILEAIGFYPKQLGFEQRVLFGIDNIFEINADSADNWFIPES